MELPLPFRAPPGHHHHTTPCTGAHGLVTTSQLMGGPRASRLTGSGWHVRKPQEGGVAELRACTTSSADATAITRLEHTDQSRAAY